MTQDAEALLRLLTERYSCRGFKPDPVPEEVISEIVVSAGRAPSWCNAQPWQVTVTSGEETDRFRRALLEVAATEKPVPDLPWPEGYPGRLWRAAACLRLPALRCCGDRAVGLCRADRAEHAQLSPVRCTTRGHRAFRGRAWPLWRARLRRVCHSLSDGGDGPWAGHNRSGLCCGLCGHDPGAFRPPCEPPDIVRHILRLCRSRSPGQWISH